MVASRRASGVCSVMLCIGAVQAQPRLNSLQFVFPNGSVYSGGAGIVVELWAGFDNYNFYAWADYEGAVLTGDVAAKWINLSSSYASVFPGLSAGTPVAGDVLDIALVQLHSPPFGYFANTDNPILLWSGEWSTTNLTARTVPIVTDSKRLSVYLTNGGVFSPVFAQAAGEIRVIPSPASVVAMLGMLCMCVRRRRG